MSFERRITTSCNSCLASVNFSYAMQDHIFNAFGIKKAESSFLLSKLLVLGAADSIRSCIEISLTWLLYGKWFW